MRNLCLFAILFYATTSFAQKASFAISLDLPLEPKMVFWGHLHSDVTGHYVLLAKGGTSSSANNPTRPTLQKYDRNFKLLYSKEFRLFKGDFGNMLYFGNKFLFCTEITDNKAKDFACVVRIVDMNGNFSLPQPVGHIEYQHKSNQPIRAKWLVSKDTSKFLAALIMDDNARLRISLNVHDHQLQKIWSKDFILPYKSAQLINRTWMLANNGQVYLLSKVYKNVLEEEWKIIDGKRQPAFEWKLFHFDPNLEKVQELSITLTDKIVTDLAFELNPQNDMICAGFYADDYNKVIQGIFIKRLNGQNGTEELVNSQAITQQEMQGFHTQEDQGGNLGLDARFHLNNLLLHDDGSIIMTAEQAYNNTQFFQSGKYGGGSETTFYNNEILLINIRPDGQIEWVRMIPKKQEFSNSTAFSGYTLLANDVSLYFLYNDDADNTNTSFSYSPNKITNFRNAIAALVTVSSTGKLSRQKVFNAQEDAGALMVPAAGVQISPEEVFFVTTRTRLMDEAQFKMGVIRLNGK